MDVLGWKSWFLRNGPSQDTVEPVPHGSLQLPSNEFSTTVFTGEAPEWLDYLQLPRAERYDPAWDVDLRWDEGTLGFSGGNEQSRLLAGALEDGYAALREVLEEKPAVRDVLDDLVFGNQSNAGTRLRLHVSSRLPSLASREVSIDDGARAEETHIVLDLASVERTLDRMQNYRGKGQGRKLVRLGLAWPLLRRLISQLSYPSFPRDRYLERIELTTKLATLNLHVTFKGKRDGELIPTRAGEIYQEYVSVRDGVPVDQMMSHHPYFRMLNNLDFMLRDNWEESHLETARIIVRDYLDTRYLRLSVASVMPEISEVMKPMDVTWKGGKKPQTDRPRIGRFGILDREDYEAWREVEKPFRDIGFVAVRQLGIGQYGRVYEAVSFRNDAIPRRVALKVDRLKKGKKSEAIEAAETILRIGQDLAHCPHVIRIYDAGKLRKRNLTYHVLQLVDGDTLDNLIGITGMEHASIMRPQIARTSLANLHEDVFKALTSSGSEAWRRKRISEPFTRRLSIPLFLDIATSMLLWLEEVHELGYTVNDLKNGNVMLSRRGQFKGIDLDSYAPAWTGMDRRVDYFFLAVSLLLFVFSFREGKNVNSSISGLMRDEVLLRKALAKIWKPTDGAEAETLNELIELMGDLVVRSQKGNYADDLALFETDIDRVISLKRSIRGEEIVLD